MPYSSDPKDYRIEDLQTVAELSFVEEASHDEIARRMRLSQRTKVAAMIEAAKKAGIVHIAILPSHTSESSRLRSLASRVQRRFGLLYCELVPGRAEMLMPEQAGCGRRPGWTDSVRQIIVGEMARAAAGY